MKASSATRFAKRVAEFSTASSPRPYKFHLAASWAGKPTVEEKKPIKRVPFPADHPIGKWRDQMLTRKPGTATEVWYPNAGEDFFFVQEMLNGSGVSFGVADGVGGWVESGVDPSLFAQALMYHAHRYSRNAWAGEPEIDPTLDYAEREEVEGWELTPDECMALSFGGVQRERRVLAGSSTACILSLNASSGLLRSANLGDSGFYVIRSAAVHHKEPAQQHFFNCPLQLTKYPQQMQTKRGSSSGTDTPEKSALREISLRHGDIVVACTDGLLDNVFAEEVLRIISLVRRTGLPDSEIALPIADNLVEYSRRCMFNQRRTSPFTVEAARHGLSYRGGKVDDVTAVVCVVEETI
ncbi:protein serine/threonine phosphatase 2C [Cylindrobasidium torrendii FP15055 ss-10]|uniref:Protein phosphatase n=1 Tax=Cylindrobasidium torrendii FP15055 ss-10 TaxID=1314674 RepID=A0A0D7BK31_9AGAR|nr:protein serine/threonine phosphatase 2C [Cylindrobasidium torrendii FP15055 ss-10]